MISSSLNNCPDLTSIEGKLFIFILVNLSWRASFFEVLNGDFMTSFPRSPRLPKGAIVAIDSVTHLITSTISFQYNPETITRRLEPRTANKDDVSRAEALRLEGAPQETFSIDIELDATDQLENADPIAVSFGVAPQIAALEMLIYPSSIQVAANMEKASAGMVEIVPMQAPMTLLVWNKTRVVPVKITSLDVEEQAYDVQLNPIRAKITLGVQVLTYDDLPWKSKGSTLFFAHHLVKEGLGAIGGLPNPAALTGL